MTNSTMIPLLIKTVDIFPGQSELQAQLNGLVHLQCGTYRWKTIDEVPFDEMNRVDLAHGKYAIHIDSRGMLAAVKAFADTSRIPVEQLELAVVVKSTTAGISAVIDRWPAQAVRQSVPLQITQSTGDLPHHGFPVVGNPLYSTEPSISIVLIANPSAETSGQVRWKASRLAECSWHPRSSRNEGALFDIRELTSEMVYELGLPGTPPYYVDVSGLSATSTDLAEVTVYVCTDIYRRYQGDVAEASDVWFAAQLATEVVVAAVTKLLKDTHQSGDGAVESPLLQRVCDQTAIDIADPADVDLQHLRVAIQSRMELAGKTIALWERATAAEEEGEDE